MEGDRARAEGGGRGEEIVLQRGRERGRERGEEREGGKYGGRENALKKMEGENMRAEWGGKEGGDRKCAWDRDRDRDRDRHRERNRGTQESLAYLRAHALPLLHSCALTFPLMRLRMDTRKSTMRYDSLTYGMPHSQVTCDFRWDDLYINVTRLGEITRVHCVRLLVYVWGLDCSCICDKVRRNYWDTCDDEITRILRDDEITDIIVTCQLSSRTIDRHRWVGIYIYIYI